ncbi:hypothetical protein LOTGIDRAFT_164663 [Lottia gigantea]|uniref:Uncharacterized protein n=1 Tax=Lottia gigantea TaxID=225164 RepID=V4A9K5_LOTGI|nr:hypothetical protein LOTGIDRAFT_164663 [Lottia gigantea]ESO89966.1 hypothetical protein LOTGIDRAFT_164663 [Lottia gigantea]
MGNQNITSKMSGQGQSQDVQEPTSVENAQIDESVDDKITALRSQRKQLRGKLTRSINRVQTNIRKGETDSKRLKRELKQIVRDYEQCSFVHECQPPGNHLGSTNFHNRHMLGRLPLNTVQHPRLNECHLLDLEDKFSLVKNKEGGLTIKIQSTIHQLLSSLAELTVADTAPVTAPAAASPSKICFYHCKLLQLAFLF